MVRFSLCIFLCLISCQSDTRIVENIYSESKDDIKNDLIINPKEAHQLMINHNDIRIIQVSKKEIYQKKHLPGAYNIWRPDYGDDSENPIKGMRASHPKIEQLLQSLDVTSETTLLLYDTKANVDAFRLAWVLDSYGFNNYKIINGGLTFWETKGFHTTEKNPVPLNKSAYTLTVKDNLENIATIKHVQLAMKDTNTIIVDTREPYEYLGQPFLKDKILHKHKTGAFVHGCIPGSVHLNWSDLSDLNGDHRIKSEKDLRYNVREAGIRKDKKIIVYCQSGSRSSHTAFVLKNILNFPNVKNYDGSWIEWSQKHMTDKSVPIEQKTDSMNIARMILDLQKQIEQTNG